MAHQQYLSDTEASTHSYKSGPKKVKQVKKKSGWFKRVGKAVLWVVGVGLSAAGVTLIIVDAPVICLGALFCIGTTLCGKIFVAGGVIVVALLAASSL
jgi:hypothetical protein